MPVLSCMELLFLPNMYISCSTCSYICGAYAVIYVIHVLLFLGFMCCYLCDVYSLVSAVHVMVHVLLLL